MEHTGNPEPQTDYLKEDITPWTTASQRQPLHTDEQDADGQASPLREPLPDAGAEQGIPLYYDGVRLPLNVPLPEQISSEKRTGRAVLWLKIGAGLIAALLIYCICSDVYLYRKGKFYVQSGAEQTQSGEAVRPSVRIEQLKRPAGQQTEGADGAYTVEGVAAAVRPAIVEIYAYSDEQGRNPIGSGSGIILTQDGYIITNEHVLSGAVYDVFTADQQKMRAQIIGRDAKTDLAVIKVEAKDLPTAALGDSDEAVLGQTVVAIGNPAGLSGSVTDGIVSGLNRRIRADATGFDMNCIQTNAAISPGNSGGALVDLYGHVIGITSSKYVNSTYEGLGFAITINEVVPIVQDLIELGYVSGRYRIGITFSSLLNDSVRERFLAAAGILGEPQDLKGVWIEKIDEDCDVAQTQLKVNDVLIAAEGKPVNSYNELCAAIEHLRAGDTMHAECRRYAHDGSYTTFHIQCRLMEDTSGNY